MSKLIPFLFIFIFTACNDTPPATVGKTVEGVDTSKKEISYPYEIGYSSQFESADPEKGKMVLELWKNFDNNTIENSKDKFADTVTMKFPGFEMHVSRDSAIAATTSHRNSFSSVVSKVDVVMSTRSTDRNGDWVLIWGREIHKDMKNVTDSVELHEVWGLNKDGKINFMEQYIR